MTSCKLELPFCLPPGPVIVGATGGSGTRVVAQLLHRAGIWLGATLSPAWDALPFGEFSDRWINAFWLETKGWQRRSSHALRQAMIADIEAILDQHLQPLVKTGACSPWQAWGWKEPRSMYLLPFWDSIFPGLRFLHLVRDGRDMAFSANQNQLARHGATVLGAAWDGRALPERSIALWAKVNRLAAWYGKHVLGQRYRAIRFEDLCLEPEKVGKKILEFLGLEPSFGFQAGEIVKPPSSLRRYLTQDMRMVAKLERIAADVLGQFRYRVSWHIRLASLFGLLRASRVK